MEQIDYVRGNYLKGGIIPNGDKTFTAVTGASSKDFKTLKGAQKYMAKFGYVVA